MKYLTKTLLFAIFLIIGNQLIGQHLGSWVIATTNQPYSANNEYRTLYYWELQFQASGLINQVCASAQGPIAPFTRLNFATSSGYYSNQELACYVASDQNQVFFYNSVGELKQTEVLNLMDPTMQIIPKPGSYAPNDPEVFCAIYTSKGHEKATPGAMWVTEIENPEGNLEIIPHKFSYRHSKNTDFCLSAELNGDRYMYYLTDEEGLNRVSILEIINNDPLYVVVENLVPYDTDLLEDHFSAHEMEMKQFADQVQFAWTTLESSGNLYMVTYDFNTNSSNSNVFSIGEGEIAGVEFSQMEDDIIYLSCANSGIVKYNYSIQQKNTLASSGEYKRTSLQTAPDGYIYAVNNNATFLGRIDQVNGVFENDIVDLTFQPGYSFEAYLLNQSVHGTLDYHMLPKHDVLSTMSETSDVSCPGMSDGTVTIYAGGGTPDYTITCLKDDVPITGFEYDENDHYFYKDGLSEGEYSYIITDARGISSEGTFIIGTNDDYYDFKDTKFEVFNNRTLPDAEFPLNTYSFEEGILVHSGATLTITGSVYEFGKNAEIIIEPGASLELVGTTLTNHEECHLMWQGIEVQGNNDSPQMPVLIGQNWVYKQGRLIMEESTIENAIEAVGLLARDDDGDILWNSGGGYVSAIHCLFLNNTKAVHFIPYATYNVSGFKDCSFEINEDYIPTETFYKHVDLDKVNHIVFTGCDFSNTAEEGVSPYNIGIAAYDAGFIVKAYCPENIAQPCADEDLKKSTFSGFYNGIRATSLTQTDKTFIVTNSEFENNAIGIFVSMINLSTIVDNNFKVGYSTPTKVYDECKGLVNSLGIDMQLAYGFAIENNTFVKPVTSTGQGDFAGIRVYNCPSPYDIIYKNTFDNLTYGNYADGINREDPEDDQTGVEYQCNKNGIDSDNYIDFMLTGSYENEAQIRTHQGMRESANRNVFSKLAELHFRNEGTQVIDWFYCSTCTDEEPTRVWSINDQYFEKIVAPNTNTCPDHYNGGGSVKLTGSELLSKELDFAQNLSDYNSVESLIESLKDGGDTYSELSDIQSAIPDDMWSLRSQLLGDSPHLTKEVLMAMSDRTDVFPDDVLFEILAANPDELSKDTLISYLENKENPLPDYMIDILRQLVGGVTYKTILLEEKADYYAAKTQAAQDILRSILNDSILDITLYRDWLDNLGGLNADKQLVASYFSEGDSSSAMALLNMIPSLYELQGDKLAEFNDYQSLLLLQEGWKQSGKHLTELDSLDLVTLYNYAVNSTGGARSTAQNILTYAENAHFCDCMHSDDSTNAKMGGASLGNSLNRIYGLEITATPNPARVYVAFNYQLPESKPEGIISISDMAGKEIQRFAVSGKQGQQVWDIRNVKSGVYLYTITSGGLQKTGKVVIN
ncbi:MAG: T9SS type A sorting domain-containing protein [Bacteroidales bacterium]|nr:T9SS type A sorting domain-containing protein [Bacteroidales bacterium]